MKLNILGAEYEVILGCDGLPDDIDGACDETVKTIRVDDYSEYGGKPMDKADLTVQFKKVLRHEIIHAFLFENGLAECCPLQENEEAVDWIAAQAPKLVKAWQEAGAL